MVVDTERPAPGLQYSAAGADFQVTDGQGAAGGVPSAYGRGPTAAGQARRVSVGEVDDDIQRPPIGDPAHETGRSRLGIDKIEEDGALVARSGACVNVQFAGEVIENGLAPEGVEKVKSPPSMESRGGFLAVSDRLRRRSLALMSTSPAAGRVKLAPEGATATQWPGAKTEASVSSLGDRQGPAGSLADTQVIKSTSSRNG